jgi:fermentation-respiration switch protein FrsA (DUF1100 family)
MINSFHNHIAVRIIVYPILFCVLLFVYIRYLERRGIYYPAREINFYPSDVNLTFEEIFVTTLDKLKINAWYIPSQQAKFTLLFCHGNAGNLMDRLDKIQVFHSIGVNIFIFDYRGFGKSQGRPGEQGIYLDAQAAYGYLVNTLKVNPSEIILYGESLGSAVAIDLARKKAVGGLIIEGGFSCGKDMAAKIYPFLPRFIFSDIFDSLAKIKEIHAPVLFIHSREDEIVPLRLAYKLYQQANPPKEFVELSGNHNVSFFDHLEKVTSSVSAFIRER